MKQNNINFTKRKVKLFRKGRFVGLVKEDFHQEKIKTDWNYLNLEILN